MALRFDALDHVEIPVILGSEGGMTSSTVKDVTESSLD